MIKRKWIIGTSATLLVLLLLASYIAVASESTGKEDPMVALSYLTDVLAPETIDRVNAAIEQKASQMETSMNQLLTEYTNQLDAKIAEFESRNENIATDANFIAAVTNSVLAGISDGGQTTGSGGGTSTLSVGGWSLVQVNSGETYKFAVGGMILLRVGSATCYTPSPPGIIDVTAGSELDGGGALQKNHLYLVTVEGRGFTASADSKIMVFGSYTVN